MWTTCGPGCRSSATGPRSTSWPMVSRLHRRSGRSTRALRCTSSTPAARPGPQGCRAHPRAVTAKQIAAGPHPRPDRRAGPGHRPDVPRGCGVGRVRTAGVGCGSGRRGRVRSGPAGAGARRAANGYAALVPAVLHAVAAVPDVARRSYPALRLVHSGSAPITEGTLRRTGPSGQTRRTTDSAASRAAAGGTLDPIEADSTTNPGYAPFGGAWRQPAARQYWSRISARSTPSTRNTRWRQ